MTQTTLQPAASRMDTAWAFRWKTPRSSGQQDEDEQQEAQVEGPVLAEREEAHGRVHGRARNGEFSRRAALSP